jgi:hypothetical protein
VVAVTTKKYVDDDGGIEINYQLDCAPLLPLIEFKVYAPALLVKILKAFFTTHPPSHPYHCKCNTICHQVQLDFTLVKNVA